MKERRGWLWLGSGVLLAIIAGLFTFQIVSELAVSASLVDDGDSPTTPVIVAVIDIPPYTAINTGMITLQDMPVNLVPQDYSANLEGLMGRISTSKISTGEVIVNHRLVDPTDPDAPVLYNMAANEVLITIPADALLSQLNMLAVGNRIDIAYTSAFAPSEDDEEAASSDTIQTAFLSLQNLEIKGLLRRTMAEEGMPTRPDAIMLSVSPQEALILKYLVDTGAPMDIFLRSPANSALLEIVPVDEQYLVDYFQLDADAPVNIIRSSRTQAENVSQTDNTSLLNTRLQEEMLQNTTETLTDEGVEESTSGQ